MLPTNCDGILRIHGTRIDSRIKELMQSMKERVIGNRKKKEYI